MFLFEKFLMDENKRIRSSIPITFEQLIIPRLQQLDQALGPGCVSLTWVSPNIDDFCDSVQRALENFDLILQRAHDLITYRIEAVLNDVTATTLCELSEDEPMSVEEFFKRTEELCAEASVQLQTKSMNVEEATEELIELLYPNYRQDHFKIKYLARKCVCASYSLTNVCLITILTRFYHVTIFGL